MGVDVCKNCKVEDEIRVCTLDNRECPFWFRPELIDENGQYKGIIICADYKPYPDHA